MSSQYDQGDSSQLEHVPQAMAPASGGGLQGYAEWVADVKQRVRATQFRVARAANAEVIRLYWSIGRDILDRQQRFGWGAKVIGQLSVDLRREFPGQRGWSPTNLKYMRMLAQAWPTVDEIGQQRADQLPWGHLMVLLDKTKNPEDRAWYADQAVTEGWSRAVLAFQIDSDLRSRLGAAPSNFQATLPEHESDLAQELTRDPYWFDVSALTSRLSEHELEQALMDRLQDTLMEFGRGMTLVGRQVRFTVDGVDRYIDLLLFHTTQLRYVVVELKVTDFEPGFVGQLGTYVAMVDDLMRHPDIHASTIGLLLCTGKRESTVRYALAATATPVAVAQWQGLPEDAREVLPTVEELETVVQEELAHQMTLLNQSR